MGSACGTGDLGQADRRLQLIGGILHRGYGTNRGTMIAHGLGHCQYSQITTGIVGYNQIA